MTFRKSISATAFVVIQIVIIGLVLCSIEISLRYLFRSDFAERDADLARIECLAYEPSDSVIVKLKSNITNTFVHPPINGGHAITWRTNSEGFRGPEIKGKNGQRVLVYGDSNIQGRFSKLSDTFSSKLQDRLKRVWSSDVEVINAGLVGAGPDQNLIRFTRDVERFGPDVVVFHIFADNDFGDLIRNRLFELDSEGELVRTNFRPVKDPMFVSMIPRFMLVRAAIKLKTMLGSHARPTVEDRVKRPRDEIETLLQVSAREYDVYKEGRVRRYSHFADHYDVDLAFYPEAESSQVKVGLMTSVLRRVKQVAQEAEVRLLIVIQPSSRDMADNLVPNYRHFMQYDGYGRNRLSSVVSDICLKLQLACVDLYPTFLRNEPQTLFYRGEDEHWNDRGQLVAADAVAAYIAEHGDPSR